MKTITLTALGQCGRYVTPDSRIVDLCGVDVKRISLDVWYVEQVTDSIEFTPGTELTKIDVRALCESPDWKVTIKAPRRE